MAGKYFLIVMIFLSFLSCNSALDKKYNPETFMEDADAIRKSNKLSDEDAEILATYLVKARLGGINLGDKTYQEILDQAKRLKLTEEQLAITEQEEREKEKRLRPLIQLSVEEKSVLERDGVKFIHLMLVFQNKKDKGIKYLSGTLVILDEMNTEMRTLPLDMEVTIRAKESLKMPELLDYSEIIEMDKQLAETPLGKLKFKWMSEKIVYEDGTLLD